MRGGGEQRSHKKDEPSIIRHNIDGILRAHKEERYARLSGTTDRSHR